MKNRQKSRSGCRTCKLRRLRCDETKPGCRNCAQKGLECPGYQQRLQWSTKHERPTTTQASGPPNFSQLATAASQSIISQPSKPVTGGPGHDGANSPAPTPAPAAGPCPLAFVPFSAPSPSPSASASASPSKPQLSTSPTTPPPPRSDVTAVTAEGNDSLVLAVRNSAPSSPQKAFPGVVSQPQATGLAMTQPVVDIPTFLIEHWFKSVCSSWSALDSDSNPYRRFTAALWNNSMPVYYALQVISAASLVERLPHVMRDTARAAPRRAAEAIQRELVAFSSGLRPQFPTELLLALFCMSSSSSWIESRQLGQYYVRQARAVLRTLDRWTLDPQSRELLEFFKGCLVYEEMLRSVVSDDEVDFNNMLSWPEPPCQKPIGRVFLHPWTGVPIDVLRLFGKAMALCRRSRTRWRLNDGTSYRILQGAMKDIEEAAQIEEALLAIAGAQLLPLDGLTPQATARVKELRYVTEAYRLCALLQLYQTFPDLGTKRLPTLKDADASVVWDTCVSPLALHVTEVLGKIPASSVGCIQPLLCLCAGSGLRYDSTIPLRHGQQRDLIVAEPGMPTPTPSTTGGGDVQLPDPSVSEKAIKISRARHLITERLDQLELILPPKPIGVAKQLLAAVWNAYDAEIGLPRRTHWLDVMSYTGLQSLFG